MSTPPRLEHQDKIPVLTLPSVPYLLKHHIGIRNKYNPTNMATVTVLYPKGTDFKMDYYMSSHMPLVQKKWSQYGLKSWKVIQYGPDAPHCVQATLEFGSMEEFKKAGGGPEAAEVMGDIKNFSDKDPLLMPGDVVGTS